MNSLARIADAVSAFITITHCGKYPKSDRIAGEAKSDKMCDHSRTNGSSIPPQIVPSSSVTMYDAQLLMKKT